MQIVHYHLFQPGFDGVFRAINMFALYFPELLACPGDPSSRR
jgi:hypothetical protein